ncbi:MAG: flavin reductase family protein [Alphaproteobacteria bacterium]|nr:flavin reductase family protein [Alphaproteobacteria bacterium]
MDFDFAALSAEDRYKLLIGLVVPRPIALVTTVSSAGRVNAAPFSFFNVLSDEPPLVIISVDAREEDETVPKDTAVNIGDTGEFVVNLVDETLLPAMNVCAVALPAGEDETAYAGLEMARSAKVKPPRIAVAPAALECRAWRTIALPGPARKLILGEVVQLHVRDDIVDDRLRIDQDRLALIGRLGGGGSYVRLNERFELKRLDVADLEARPAGRRA